MTTQERTPATAVTGAREDQADKPSQRANPNTAKRQELLDELGAARHHLELRAEANEVIAAWRDELRVRLARSKLKAELIGIDDDEHDALVAEVGEFKRLCAALGWTGRRRA